MVTHRIVCVTTEHPHRHIVSVGVGTSAASPSQTFTVKQIRDKRDNGDIFYTQSPTGEHAFVRADDCKVDGCAVETIRSAPDAVTNNNLDNLAICP